MMSIKISRFTIDAYDQVNAIGVNKCHLFIFEDNKEGMIFWESLGWSYRSDISVISKTIQ